MSAALNMNTITVNRCYMFKVPENCRILMGPLASTEECGNNGAFQLGLDKKTIGSIPLMYAISSDGGGWEHVSVSVAGPAGGHSLRCPTWGEMSRVKDIFWDEEDCVIQ